MLNTPLYLFAFILLFLFSSTAIAQNVPLRKLEIKSGKVYVAPKDNILKIDTLIMHDKAAIKFDPGQYGVLQVGIAFVGNKCLITSKGTNGRKAIDSNQGEDGESGGNLSLVIHFERLGKLTIDTRGG